MWTVRTGTKPAFLIVGAMRSGPTSLARALGSHPEVYMAPEKEVHFFDLHHQDGVEWYTERFAAATRQRQVGEATPYMHDSAHADGCRRRSPTHGSSSSWDPLSRAYSHYSLNRAKGIERLAFAEAIAAEPDRLATHDELEGRRYAYVRAGRSARTARRPGSRYRVRPCSSSCSTTFEGPRGRSIGACADSWTSMMGSSLPRSAVR